MESTEKPPEKQTRTRLTFAQKVQVLQRLEKGEKQATIAKELGCSRRALSRLKQNKAFFQQLQLQPADSQRKSRHSIRNLALESNLTSFLSTAKCNGFPVTGSVVRLAALKIRDELLADPELPSAERASLQGFQASINWSKAFIKRRGLRNAQLTPEDPIKPADDATRRQVTNLLREYDLDCILSVEKLNLFYQTLPSDLLSSLPQASSSDTTETPRKYSLQERVVVLVASNTTGTLKIPPTIVWKDKLPHCFDRRPCPLPHLYHPRAWVDEDVWKTWFCSVLLPAVRQHTSKKVALLVHDDDVQNEVCDRNGQVQVLGVPSLRMNDGPFHCGMMSVLRRRYRYSVLDMVIRTISSGYEGFQSGFGGMSSNGGLMEGQRANLLDLGDLLREAWGNMSESFIGKCWVKNGMLPDEHNRALVEAYGRHGGTTGEELYASCCSEAELEHGRGLEKVLVECRVGISRIGVGSTRTMDVVNKLNNVTQREIDAWFEVEESARGLRALGSELDEIINNDEDSFVTKKGMKRSVEEMMGEAEDGSNMKRRQRGTGSRLPSVGYLMDLIAPLEGVLDEEESSKVGELVRKLKVELVGLKSEEEDDGEVQEYANTR